LSVSLKELDILGFETFDVEVNKGVYEIIWIDDHESTTIHDRHSDVPIKIVNYYEECIKEFTDRVEKYLIIHEAIGKRLATRRYINSSQHEYHKHFYKYIKRLNGILMLSILCNGFY